MGFQNVIAETIDQVVSVGVVQENVAPLDAPCDDIVNRAGGVSANWSGHGLTVA